MKLATRGEAFGCLVGLLGSVLGAGAGTAHFAHDMAEVRARHPGTFVCGNGAIAGLFGGALLGGLAGAVGGMVLHLLFPPKGKK